MIFVSPPRLGCLPPCQGGALRVRVRVTVKEYWRVRLCAIAAAIALLGCRKEPPQDVSAVPEVSMSDSSTPMGARGEAGDGAAGSSDRTVIALPSGNVEATLADGPGLREALLKQLHASDVPDRDELIQWTEHASARVDPEGGFRLGTWVLGELGGELVLSNRLHQTSEGMLIYLAPVAKEHGVWTVKEVQSEIVHARR